MNSASNLHSTSLSSKTVDKTVDKQVDKPVGKKRSRSAVRRKESDVIVLDDSDTQPMKRQAVTQSVIVIPNESPEPTRKPIESSVVNAIPDESPESAMESIESSAAVIIPDDSQRPIESVLDNVSRYTPSHGVSDEGEVNDLFQMLQPSFTTMKLPLGGERYVTASMFRGQMMIHVRQFTDDGSPVKGKGLAMTLEQWVELVDSIEGIDLKIQSVADKAVPDFKHHLGSNKYARVNTDFFCVDLRQFWLPEGMTEVIPTKRGISLNFKQWTEFKVAAVHVPVYVPAVLSTEPCMQRTDHVNQMGFWECRNCNPDFEQLQGMH